MFSCWILAFPRKSPFYSPGRGLLGTLPTEKRQGSGLRREAGVSPIPCWCLGLGRWALRVFRHRGVLGSPSLGSGNSWRKVFLMPSRELRGRNSVCEEEGRSLKHLCAPQLNCQLVSGAETGICHAGDLVQPLSRLLLFTTAPLLGLRCSFLCQGQPGGASWKRTHGLPALPSKQ